MPDKSKYKALYKAAVEALAPLYKQQNESVIPKLNNIAQKYEKLLLQELNAFLDNASKRFVENLDYSLLAGYTKLAKEGNEDNGSDSEDTDSSDSEHDDVVQYLRRRFALALGIAGPGQDDPQNEDDLTNTLLPIVQEAVKEYSIATADTHDFKLGFSFNQPDARAVDALKNKMTGDFSNMPDDLAQGFLDAIARQVGSTNGGNTIKNIAKTVAAGVLSENLTFPSKTISRKDWSQMVATSLTRTAASESAKQLASELDIKFWLWNCNNEPCQVCAPNDGVTVEIGTPFPNGFEQPSCHPLCRCVVILQNQIVKAIGSDYTQ